MASSNLLRRSVLAARSWTPRTVQPPFPLRTAKAFSSLPSPNGIHLIPAPASASASASSRWCPLKKIWPSLQEFQIKGDRVIATLRFYVDIGMWVIIFGFTIIGLKEHGVDETLKKVLKRVADLFGQNEEKVKFPLGLLEAEDLEATTEIRVAGGGEGAKRLILVINVKKKEEK